MNLSSRLAVLALLASSTLVYAGDAPAPQTTSTAFASIDRNGDQRISKTEAGMHKHIIDRFATIDANGDGFITADELTANPTARASN